MQLTAALLTDCYCTHTHTHKYSYINQYIFSASSYLNIIPQAHIPQAPPLSQAETGTLFLPPTAGSTICLKEQHTHTLTRTFPAFRSSPALQTLLVAVVITLVVPEEVIAGSAQFVALVAVVMAIAAHTYTVLNTGSEAQVMDLLTLISRVHLSTINTALDQLLVICHTRIQSNQHPSFIW